MSLLEVRDLIVEYPGVHEPLRAVNGVSFSLEAGELVGLVGCSGCGKSTTARAIMGLERPTAGGVFLDGCRLSAPYSRSVYNDLQMVFQMPRDSFDPKRSIGAALVSTQVNFGATRVQASQNTARLLESVGLDGLHARKRPHELSGGEAQRAAIARAFSVAPRVLICDEATSALDVSVQAQVVELLTRMCAESGTAVLFVSHDIALVQGICSRILVMHAGRIVEQGTVAEVVGSPQSPYTKQLIGAVL